HYFEITRLANEQPLAANVHLAAADSPSGIVFLHEVRPGPASRSYGIQVAQRAGIPPAVIRQATRELARLEAQGGLTPQLDLFAVPAAEANNSNTTPLDESDEFPLDTTESDPALKDALAKLDPDEMTPREALDALY